MFKHNFILSILTVALCGCVISAPNEDTDSGVVPDSDTGIEPGHPDASVEDADVLSEIDSELLRRKKDAGTVVVDSGVKDSGSVFDPSTLSYIFCSNEFSQCSFTGTKWVRFGMPGAYNYKQYTNGVSCDFRTLGDPAPGQTKTCAVEGAAPVVVDAGAPKDAGVVVKDAGSPVVVDAGGPIVVVPGAVKRPVASKGVGFFTVGSKIYDANGVEFRFRGTNVTHWDNASIGDSQTGSNTSRIITDFSRSPQDNIKTFTSPQVGWSSYYKKVIVPGNWDQTCNSDVATFDRIVNTWVSQMPTWNTIEKFMVLNIANEALSQAVWKDKYIEAIAKLRAAGSHHLLMVDSSDCGQSADTLIKYGKAVVDSDPEHNTMLSLHVYGMFADTAGGVPKSWSGQAELEPSIQAIAATGVPWIIGEFGPGRNIGASPTLIDPKRVIQLAEKYNVGWLSWSVNDNNLGNAQADDNSFSLFYDTTAAFSTTNLTKFGKVVVMDTEVGTKYLAKPATIF